ncbi:hypothetical protein BDZ89DRAFT_235423 [Hymenopellis radicata]|nr:hypothetical protein BDZ89DRAFT_235423 [Hymenopellis radicata]
MAGCRGYVLRLLFLGLLCTRKTMITICWTAGGDTRYTSSHGARTRNPVQRCRSLRSSTMVRICGKVFPWLHSSTSPYPRFTSKIAPWPHLNFSLHVASV